MTTTVRPDVAAPEDGQAAAPAVPDAPPSRRSEALDRFRGAALVLMLLHHLTGWLSGDARKVLPGWPDFTVTDLAAPAFFIAAGASCALFVASRRRRGMPRWRVGTQVLRRYGLLVPVGMALGWLLWADPISFGVLEALGVTVVLAVAVAAVLPGWLLAVAAGVALVVGIAVERDVTGETSWAASELLGGNFPLITYLGFVLAGMAAARTGRLADRRWGAGAALAGVGMLATMFLDGVVPARYPGDVGLVVPGLAGSAVVYALCQRGWPAALSRLDTIVQRAAAHTFGIFLAHYALYWALDRAGVRGTVPGPAAVAAAATVTVALCLAAAHVPPLPWSPRTGRRRPAAPDPR